MIMTISVGGEREPSSVIIDGSTISAYPGKDTYSTGNDDVGGDGYCGGGASGLYGGGSDGGDGMGSASGHGTGEDITAFHFDNWVITPGAGGDYYDGGIRDEDGGGGGGVLVNGIGPDRNHQNNNNCQGQGYGGGGCVGGYQYVGLPGVVLIEVGP